MALIKSSKVPPTSSTTSVFGLNTIPAMKTPTNKIAAIGSASEVAEAKPTLNLSDAVADPI